MLAATSGRARPGRGAASAQKASRTAVARLDREAQEVTGLGGRGPFSPEALDRALVARGRDAVGARVQVGPVDGCDGLGMLAQEAGGPQRMGEVEARALQLGGEAPVEDEARRGGEEGPQGIVRGAQSHGVGRRGRGPGNTRRV